VNSERQGMSVIHRVHRDALAALCVVLDPNCCHRGEASVEEIRASSQRYDNHYVDSPVWRDEVAGA
jgi:hypothetical protein